MAKGDLIIDDEYIFDMAGDFNKFDDAFNDAIDKYIIELEKLRSTGIKSGDVAKSLDVYILQAKKLKSSFLLISKNINCAGKNTSEFGIQIDHADQYLFEGSM